MGKLTAGLAGLLVPCPSGKALRDLRRRLGPAPLKALFEVAAGPLAQPGTPGVRFAGLRTGFTTREIESACFALRHTLLAGHVLRSGDRPGLEQEI